MNPSLHRRLAEIFGALFALAFFGAIFIAMRPTPHRAETKPTPPTLTQEEAGFVERNAPVAALISYSDTGFEPATTTIHRGDTVRFFNASQSTPLWVSADGTVYPGQSDCGGSGLDTCHTIEPQHFWEFTFAKAGTWKYKNNAVPLHVGVVVVE